MKVFASRRLSALACGAVLSGCLSAGAWAQALPNAPLGTGNIAGGRRTPSAVEKPAIPPPDAIPGAKAREPAAPAKGVPTDMVPNDALFDAINRGDIAAARDALNRGANLNATNILGMTAMELSVDLGRNDISFLLLSMRGEDSDRRSTTQPREAAAPASPAAKAIDRAPGVGKRRIVARASAPAKPPRVATQASATAKLFANDGGTPLPNAGFLGFSSRSATN